MTDGWQGEGYNPPNRGNNYLSRHDHKIGALEVGLAETRADVGAIRREISNLTASVSQLADYLKQGAKPHWGPTIGVGTIVLTMLVAFGAFFGTAISRNTDAITHVAAQTQDHLLDAGHPKLVLEKVNANRDLLSALADGVKDHLLSTGHMPAIEKIKNLDKKVELLEGRQRRAHIDSATNISSLKARITALEALLKTLGPTVLPDAAP